MTARTTYRFPRVAMKADHRTAQQELDPSVQAALGIKNGVLLGLLLWGGIIAGTVSLLR